MLTIRSTFLYLDRTYVISTSGTRSLFEMGLYAYGQHLAEHPEVMPLSLVLPGLQCMPLSVGVWQFLTLRSSWQHMH